MQKRDTKHSFGGSIASNFFEKTFKIPLFTLRLESVL